MAAGGSRRQPLPFISKGELPRGSAANVSRSRVESPRQAPERHESGFNLPMLAYNPIPIVEIETERLLLRPTALSDAPRTQELFDNFGLLRYMAAAIPWPYPETGAVDYITGLLPKIEGQETYAWTILEKHDL